MRQLFPVRTNQYKRTKGTLCNTLHSNLLNNKGMLRFRDLAAIAEFWRKFTLVARNMISL